MRPGVRIALLAAILAGAAWLRLWGVTQGLPNVNARPDETEMLTCTAGFRAGDFNPRWFVYPNLFIYLSWAWIEVCLAVRRLFVETVGYVALLQSDRALLILYGRLLSVAAGTLTVLLAYRIGARLRGAACGLVAAALLATCWLHVRDSHFLKTEALLALAALFAMDRLARWAASERRRDALLAGAAIGVATGIKYPALFLLVPAWIADVLRPGRRGVRLLPSADLLVIGVATVAAFFVVSPFVILDAGRMKDTVDLLSIAIYATRPDAVIPADAGPLDGLLGWLRSRAFGYHATVSLRYGMGLLPALVLPIAVVRALVRPEPFLRMSAVFCVVSYLVAGASPVHLARYVTIITPFAAVLLAELVVTVARGRGWLVVGLTALLAAEPLALSVAGDRIGAQPDTRVAATEWMRTQLPPGSVVAILGTKLLPSGQPVAPPNVRTVHLPEPTPAAMAEAKVTHVLTHDHLLEFSTVDPAVMTALAPHLRLLTELTPYTGEPGGRFERVDAYYIPFADLGAVARPGPRVRIYAFTPPTS